MVSIEHYKVNLPSFEGPLDLLLYLIRKNDLKIYDIPISIITGEYLKYLDRMQELNIDLAGEFVVMASELARIKSRLLLPQEGEEEAEEGGDPRAELARRLLEYQRYKEAGANLFKRRMLGRELFKHPPERTQANLDVPIESDVYKLIDAFSATLRRLPKKAYHHVAADRMGITQRIYQIVDLLEKKESLEIHELLPEPLTRFAVVITFIALLEMAKLRMIQVYQESNFDNILIRRTMTTEQPLEKTLQGVDAEGEVSPWNEKI